MKPKESYLVTQANKLVEARFHLSVYEQRIILMMTSLIQPDDEDFKEYKIKVSDFVDLLGLKGNSVHENMKGILVQLRERTLIIEKENSKDYLVTGWIDSAEYVSRDGSILLSFSPRLKPYLIQVKNKFLSLKLGSLLKLKNSYSLRIYTLLKQYEKVGYRDFSLSELKETLGIEQSTYPVYSEFKRNVITPTQKELKTQNNSGVFEYDMSFDIEPRKEGRKIVGLKFVIIKQDTTPPLLDVAKSKTLDILLSYGIGRARSIELSTDYSEAEIVKCITIFEEKKAKGMVKNDGVGLLIKLIEDGAGVKTQEESKKEKALQLKREAEQQERLNNRRDILGREFNKRAKKLFIENLSPSEKEDLLSKALHEHQASPLLSFIERDGLEATVLGAFILNRVDSYEDRKEQYIAENL